MRLLHADGRSFVKNSRRKYDMIIVDAPDPATAVLNRYYTVEFFQYAKNRLRPDGVLIVRTTSAPDLRDRALANRNATVYHTHNQVFSHVLVSGEHSLHYFATNTEGQISIAPEVLAERYRQRRIESESFNVRHYRILLRQPQTRRINWIVRHHGREDNAALEGPPPVPLSPAVANQQENGQATLPPVQKRYFVNSDFRPIGYYYTLMYWEKSSRGRDRETFARLLTVNYSSWGGLAIGICLVAALSLRLAGRRRGYRPVF